MNPLSPVRWGLGPLLFSAPFACQTQPAVFSQGANDTPQACEDRKRNLLDLLGRMPERSLVTDFHTTLAESTLGAAPGAGPVLEVSETKLSLDGEALEPAAWAARAKALPSPGALYVAAAADVTIRALRAALLPVPKSVVPRLLVRVHAAASLAAEAGTPERAQRVAARLLTEHDANTRRALSEQGFAEFSSCTALSSGVSRAGRVPPNGRWPALRAELAGALPGCACSSFDAGALRALVAAEQRAGTASLGALPLAFLRDERCEASMGLRSVQRLLEQMERFDADYAGKITDDAVRFEQVITSDRLLVEFCDALPGETLASLEKKKATLYWRVPGSSECQAWTFAPLSPGAPLGTWRRSQPGQATVAFHYWQAAEELSVFGPVSTDPPSKPTDRREWPCRTSYKLSGIDEDSIELESGRWYFDEAHCRAASDATAPGGCAATQGG